MSRTVRQFKVALKLLAFCAPAALVIVVVLHYAARLGRFGFLVLPGGIVLAWIWLKAGEIAEGHEGRDGK